MYPNELLLSRNHAGLVGRCIAASLLDGEIL